MPYWARPICDGSCGTIAAIITRSGRTGHWTKMRLYIDRFSRMATSLLVRYSAGYITITSEFRFSVHTAVPQSLHVKTESSERHSTTSCEFARAPLVAKGRISGQRCTVDEIFSVGARTGTGLQRCCRGHIATFRKPASKLRKKSSCRDCPSFFPSPVF